ncbi:MAG: NAD(P)H-binding protein [Solirubrobacteraceae bacterium]
MILLTGATGLVGTALLSRLTKEAEPVRCLVRDPRRLGVERVRVQIALGDLTDPQSFRHALRGVSTVVHLAASIRDQGPPGAGRSIEELNGVATWRLVQAAERAGVQRFVFFSALGASTRSRARFMRAKALAERAVGESPIPHTVFAPSIVYSPGDPFLKLLERLSLLPAVPISGRGRAPFQPIWVEDVADCVHAALAAPDRLRERYELAGPDTLSYRAIVELAVRATGRRRALVPVPLRFAERALGAAEAVAGRPVLATPDELELMEVPMVSRLGTADAESLGVRPRAMPGVLGAAA